MNAQEAIYKLQVARTLLGTGMAQPIRADKALRALAALRRWGPTSAAAYIGAAIRHPDRAALVDERGTLTFGEVNRRTNALARQLRAAGVSEQDGGAIMCRNHRGFIDATVACAKLGASALYLNTAFAGGEDRDRSIPVDGGEHPAINATDNARRRENVERLRELAERHGDEVELICSHDAASL